MADFVSEDFAGIGTSEVTAFNASWTRHTSYAVDSYGSSLYSGKVRSGYGISAYWHSGSPGSADYTVQADVMHPGTPPGAAGNGVCGRMDTAANTFYMARVNYGVPLSSSNLQLFKCITGSFTQLGSNSGVSVSTGTSYQCKLKMTGSTIELYWNGSGSASISQTDSAITSAGKAGFRVAGTSAENECVHQDNFLASDLAAFGFPFARSARRQQHLLIR